MIRLTEAEYAYTHHIWVHLIEGMSGVVDFTDISKKVSAARALADQKNFLRFYVDEWPKLASPCGFTFLPEGLYERAPPKGDSVER